MHAILEAIAGPAAGTTFELADDDIALVGRSPRCHFIIDTDLHCSRVHFLLELRSPDCRLLDLGSTNGTTVNGQRVAETAIRDGDEIRIGESCLVVSLQAKAEAVLEDEEPAARSEDLVAEEAAVSEEPRDAVIPDAGADDSDAADASDAAPSVHYGDSGPVVAGDPASEAGAPPAPIEAEPAVEADGPQTEETEETPDAPDAEEEPAMDEQVPPAMPDTPPLPGQAEVEEPPEELEKRESAPADEPSPSQLEEPDEDAEDPPVEVFLAAAAGADSSAYRCFRCGQAIGEAEATGGDDVLVCEECRTQLHDAREPVPGYRLENALRECDSYEVWQAVEISTGRKVIAQVVVPDVAASRRAIRMFRRERVTLPRLRHENITECLAAGQFEGVMFIVVEHFDGRSVTQLLEEAGGRLAAADAVSISLQVLRALEYAHQLRSVHRSITPASIIVRGESPDFAVKLTGFGLARVLGATDKHRAGAGASLGGALACMAPEQVLNCRGIDLRADIFGLGATLYHMLTGEFCYGFRIDEQDPLVTIVEEEVIPIEQRAVELPPDLVRVVNRAIRKDPGQRFASAGEMRAALAGIRL